MHAGFGGGVVEEDRRKKRCGMEDEEVRLGFSNGGREEVMLKGKNCWF